VQKYIWSIFYSVSVYLKDSAELRTIKYVIERNEKLDLIKFFQHVKNMLATVCSISEILMMDNLTVMIEDLSQVLTAIYGGDLIKKVHLLTPIKARSRDSGIISSELCIILISDYVQQRENKFMMDSRPKVDFAEFFASPLSPGNETSSSKDSDLFVQNSPSTLIEGTRSMVKSKTKKKRVRSPASKKVLQKEALVYSIYFLLLAQLART